MEVSLAQNPLEVSEFSHRSFVICYTIIKMRRKTQQVASMVDDHAPPRQPLNRLSGVPVLDQDERRSLCWVGCLVQCMSCLSQTTPKIFG